MLMSPAAPLQQPQRHEHRVLQTKVVTVGMDAQVVATVLGLATVRRKSTARVNQKRRIEHAHLPYTRNASFLCVIVNKER